jgi:hypothetical protein
MGLIRLGSHNRVLVYAAVSSTKRGSFRLHSGSLGIPFFSCACCRLIALESNVEWSVFYSPLSGIFRRCHRVVGTCQRHAFLVLFKQTSVTRLRNQLVVVCKRMHNQSMLLVMSAPSRSSAPLRDTRAPAPSRRASPTFIAHRRLNVLPLPQLDCDSHIRGSANANR